MSTASVPFATMAAAAVRGCSANLAKRGCNNLVFVSSIRKETKEFSGPQKRPCSNLAFVPQHKETQERDIELLQEFLSPSKKLLVLTGAGALLYKQLFGFVYLCALYRNLDREWNPRLQVRRCGLVCNQQ